MINFAAGIVFFWLYDKALKLVFEHLRRKKEKKIYNSLPRAVPIDPSKFCSDHDFYDTVLGFLNNGFIPGSYEVCRNCGMIRGEDKFMVSDEAIVSLNENILKREKLEKAEHEYKKKVMEYSDRYITDYLLKHFDQEINDPNYLEKLHNLVEYSISARERAEEQVRKTFAPSEQDSQDENKFFWTTNSGNA